MIKSNRTALEELQLDIWKESDDVLGNEMVDEYYARQKCREAYALGVNELLNKITEYYTSSVYFTDGNEGIKSTAKELANALLSEVKADE